MIWYLLIGTPVKRDGGSTYRRSVAYPMSSCDPKECGTVNNSTHAFRQTVAADENAQSSRCGEPSLMVSMHTRVHAYTKAYPLNNASKVGHGKYGELTSQLLCSMNRHNIYSPSRGLPLYNGRVVDVWRWWYSLCLSGSANVTSSGFSMARNRRPPPKLGLSSVLNNNIIARRTA